MESPAERETIAVGGAPKQRPRPRNPAKTIARAVILSLVALIGWNAVSDRLAPQSSRGTVSGYVARIAPRVSGQVVQVFAQDNAIVQAGDPLFALDQRPFELAVRQAEVKLVQATQAINASAAALIASQSKVAQARASLEFARGDASRMAILVERGAAALAQGDSARSNLITAEENLRAAEAQLRSAEVQLGPAGAGNPQVQGAQLALEQAQFDLLSATVGAPRHGVVTNVQLAVGQFIAAGTPAMTFIDAQGAWITSDLRENQLVNVDRDDVVELLFDAVPGKIFKGRVHSVAWGIDPGRPSAAGLMQNLSETRWFEPARRMPVRIELEGGMDNWPRGVRAGGKVTVVVYASGTGNPVAWLSAGILRARGLFSFLF